MRMIRINCSVSLVTFLWMMILVRADTDVTCVVKESCILPCSFQKDTEVVIKWTKMTEGHPRVHSFSKNQDQLGDQDQDFRNRTSLFKDQISRGDASLLLTGVKVEDKGQYQCYTRTTSGIQRSIIKLEVKDTEVNCYATGNCMLPCSFQEGREVFIQWTKVTAGSPRVHSFSNNQDQLGDQDQNFRGRTSLSKDQISRGNASLLLTGVKVQDQGQYLCYTRTTSGTKKSIINLNVIDIPLIVGVTIAVAVVVAVAVVAVCIYCKKKRREREKKREREREEMKEKEEMMEREREKIKEKEEMIEREREEMKERERKEMMERERQERERQEKFDRERQEMKEKLERMERERREREGRGCQVS